MTLRPLVRCAVVMAVIMLLPDSGSAAGPKSAPARSVTTTVVVLDISTLPTSAFGDSDETSG